MKMNIFDLEDLEVYVKNLHGTSSEKYKEPPKGYTSWRAFWEKKIGRKFGLCSAIDCGEDAEVGGHVIKVGSSREWYIVPLCKEHNSYANDKEFCVMKDDLCPVKD